MSVGWSLLVLGVGHGEEILQLPLKGLKGWSLYGILYGRQDYELCEKIKIKNNTIRYHEDATDWSEGVDRPAPAPIFNISQKQRQHVLENNYAYRGRRHIIFCLRCSKSNIVNIIDYLPYASTPALYRIAEEDNPGQLAFCNHVLPGGVPQHSSFLEIDR